MFIDAQHIYSDAQAVTSSAASTNVIDHGAAGDAGVPLKVYVTVDTAFTTSTSATLTVSLYTDSVEAISSPTTLITSQTFAASALTEGAVLLNAYIPAGMEQYTEIYYTVGTGTFTAGKVNAQLVFDAPSNL